MQKIKTMSLVKEGFSFTNKNIKAFCKNFYGYFIVLSLIQIAGLLLKKPWDLKNAWIIESPWNTKDVFIINHPEILENSWTIVNPKTIGNPWILDNAWLISLLDFMHFCIVLLLGIQILKVIFHEKISPKFGGLQFRKTEVSVLLNNIVVGFFIYAPVVVFIFCAKIFSFNLYTFVLLCMALVSVVYISSRFFLISPIALEKKSFVLKETWKTSKKHVRTLISFVIVFMLIFSTIYILEVLLGLFMTLLIKLDILSYRMSSINIISGVHRLIVILISAFFTLYIEAGLSAALGFLYKRIKGVK